MFPQFITIAIFFFLSRFSFTNILESQDCREGGGYFFNSSLPLPPDSQTLRHQPGNYCRELTSAHSQQPYSNREPLVLECKSPTTQLRALELVLLLILFFMSREMFVYNFTMSNLVSLFPHALRHRIREKRISPKSHGYLIQHKKIEKTSFNTKFLILFSSLHE